MSSRSDEKKPTVVRAAADQHFAVRPSRIHGRGLFATTRIPRRMKLGELSGILRPIREANHDHQQRRVIKLVEVSRRWALDCTHGNHFSLLNHSCQANCYLRIIRRRVEVYSRGPIRSGAELTVDYGETMHPDGMGCQCGVPGCRSRI
jgi:SET domain-containing protein